MISYWIEQVSIFSTSLTSLISSLNTEIEVYAKNSKTDKTQDRLDHITLLKIKNHLQEALSELDKAKKM